MEPNQIPPVQVTPVVVPPPPTKTSYGALIGIVVVTAAIATGAYYLFNARVDELVAIAEEQQASVTMIDTQSKSTEPEAIEEDLSAVPPEDFEKDLAEAFAQLDASFETTSQ
jgi:hypothetical protein